MIVSTFINKVKKVITDKIKERINEEEIVFLDRLYSWITTNGILSPAMRIKLLIILELYIILLIYLTFDGDTRSRITATA